MKWMMVVVVMVAGMARADDAPKKDQVDPEAYKAALERLKAKAEAGPSEVERLRKENRELKDALSAARDRVAELEGRIKLLAGAADHRKGTAKPGVFEFTWSDGPDMGWGQLIRASSEAEAIRKAKSVGIPLFLTQDVDGNETVYTGMRRLSDEEAKGVTEKSGGRYPIVKK